MTSSYSAETTELVKDLLNNHSELRPDLNSILERKFLLHYIKLTLIRLVTCNSKKSQQSAIPAQESVDKSRKSTEKKTRSNSKNKPQIKLNQLKMNEYKMTGDNSSKSQERILIDNSSNNSKFKRMTNLQAYKTSNNPSENNTLHNRSRSHSKSKEIFEEKKYSKKTQLKDSKQRLIKNEKKSGVDDRINILFRAAARGSKHKSQESYSDISSTSNIDLQSHSHSTNKKDDKSTFAKVEKLKSYLEKILGLEFFMELYFTINVLQL